MTCHQFDAALSAYLTGTLAESENVELELHASSCDRCGPLLSAATALPMVPPGVAPPPALRAKALTAVRRIRWIRRGRVWGAGIAIAAAAVLVLSTTPAPDSGVPSAPGKTSSVLAIDRAQPEFDALDRAARELESALLEAPDDPALRGFLATVNERRAALSRQVKDAAT